MAEREHQQHDLLLVAAHAAGDAEGADLARAEVLISSCSECATLASDLRAIAVATAALPAPRRPRDFFVQPADAARLRPNPLRRLARGLAGRGSPLTRPLAGGLIMAGFAGLLVAALPGMTQRGASAPTDQRMEFAASPSPQVDIQGQPAVPASSRQPYSTEATFGGIRGGTQASTPPAPGAAQTPLAGEPATPKATRDVASTGPSLLVIVSVALVGIGALVLAASLIRPALRPR